MDFRFRPFAAGEERPLWRYAIVGSGRIIFHEAPP